MVRYEPSGYRLLHGLIPSSLAGGSFSHRTEVVKTKAKVATVDRRNALLIAWFTCALSKVGVLLIVQSSKLIRIAAK